MRPPSPVFGSVADKGVQAHFCSVILQGVAAALAVISLKRALSVSAESTELNRVEGAG